MEKTDEWQGAGMEYTTEYRQYDPRLGRWMSLDPMAPKYPWQSPYVGMDNNPVALNDPDGDCTGPDCPDANKNQGAHYMVNLIHNVLDNIDSQNAKREQVIQQHVNVNHKPQSNNSTSNSSGTSNNSTPSSSGPILATATVVAGTVEQTYSGWEQGYDHNNYVTTKGLVKPIFKANGEVRSAQAQKALYWSKGVKGTGLGLNIISTGLGYAQVYSQYTQGGATNISPINAAEVGFGTVGTIANGMSFLGYGGAAVSAIGNTTGFIGLGIQSGLAWYMIYQPVFDMQNYNMPTTNNVDEAEWNQKMRDMGVMNEGDLYGNN